MAKDGQASETKVRCVCSSEGSSPSDANIHTFCRMREQNGKMLSVKSIRYEGRIHIFFITA